MSLIPGLKCEILDDTCCGLSGSYGFKKSNESTAIQIGNRAVARIKKTGADAIVADCGSCRMQLGGLSGMTSSIRRKYSVNHWELKIKNKLWQLKILFKAKLTDFKKYARLQQTIQRITIRL